MPVGSDRPNSPARLPLLKGTRDLLVLKALAWHPTHGVEIIAWLEERSGGSLDVDDGALYYALNRMEERDFIAAEWRVTNNNRRAPGARTSLARLHQTEGSEFRLSGV
jgi:hypothetical protein